MNQDGAPREIAILGTGTMGFPIARNLAKAGFKVRAWNRTRSKAEPLAADGAIIADSAAEAVTGADVVITMLTDAAAVRRAIEAAGTGLAFGAVWVQMSTVGARPATELAELATKHRLIYVDAPVQGSRQPAEQAQLVIIAAGPAHVRRELEPLFDAVSRRTMWVDDDGASGAASRVKLAFNHYVFGITHAAAEALDLARKLGVDPAFVADVITGGPVDNPFFQAKSRAMLEGDFAPSFSLANAAKDARLIAEAAQFANVRADLAQASVERFERAIAAGHGDKDMAASFLAG